MNEGQRKQYLLEFGNRIKKLRIERNMSQDELAKKSGYGSRSTINKIELGINDIPQSKIKMLAEALNVSIEILMGWQDELPSIDYMSIGANIRKWREIRNLKQSELAELLNVSDKTVSSWEVDRTEPKMGMIEKICIALNCKKTDIIGKDFPGDKSDDTKRRGVKINVLGRVAAGLPLEAIENIIDTEEISEELACTGEFFGLQIRGDSMEPRICDGDVVIVRCQENAESGDTVIALVNGNDAVCKRLAKYSDGIGLISLNSAKYEPMIFSSAEIQSKPVKIIGKVVELRGKL